MCDFNVWHSFDQNAAIMWIIGLLSGSDWWTKFLSETIIHTHHADYVIMHGECVSDILYTGRPEIWFTLICIA